MHYDRALAEWADLKEHMVRRFANVHTSKMWRPWPRKGCMHNGLTCGCVLEAHQNTRTHVPCHCRSLSLCCKGGRLECNAMHMLRTCVSTRSCILPVNLPRNDMARSIAASARPQQRVSRQLDAQESVEATVLQCLQGNEAVAVDGDILPVFGRLDTLLATKAASRKGAEGHKADVLTFVAVHICWQP